MMNLNETAARHGFCVDRVRESEELHGKMVEMHHEKTGAQLVWVDNGEVNKTFCVAFKTLPEDSTGVFHILEHSVLCGSAKYPVREPFVELMKSSMATFLNAMTFPDKTIYPVSSRNEQDFLNLTEVYLDAVFAPRILQDPNIFYQEGWHIELDENGAPLSGVEFALVTETGTRLTTAVSDANGLVTFEKIPYGRYTVEETQPLPGYFKAAVHVRLTVDGTFINPNEPLETVTNTPMRLAYKKVDTSGRPLAGVEFSLINAATNVVTEVATSDENGEFIFRHIDYGDWIIRETAAPNGYRRMEDVLLHIGEDFVQPEPITLVNVPNSYMFMKMDGDGNPLSGVKFVLEDADGNVLREMESGEDGTVLLENLDDGQYAVRETEALQGYVKTEDTLTFSINESYVVPEEMPCLVNEKEDEKHDIQTGVDIELTPMMTEGAALLLLAGIILIGRRLAGRKRRKK